MSDEPQNEPEQDPSVPGPGENRWGPKLFEHQYRAMEHAFDLPPWDDLTDEQKEQLVNRGRIPANIEEICLSEEEEAALDRAWERIQRESKGDQL